tara:strand:- start:321 stop:452 length:132 start_codon:yes stop_codon:yes gene_type:complete
VVALLSSIVPDKLRKDKGTKSIKERHNAEIDEVVEEFLKEESE